MQDSTEISALGEECKRYGNLEINFVNRCVTIDGQRVELSALKYSYMELLAANLVVSRDRILDELHAKNKDIEVKNVDVQICQLRKTLAEASRSPNFPRGLEYIETVWKKGYRLRQEPVAARPKKAK